MSIKELNRLIEEHFELDTSDFSEDTLLSEFITDDVDLSLLVESISSEFGFLVDDETAESWKSLSDVISTLEEMS